MVKHFRVEARYVVGTLKGTISYNGTIRKKGQFMFRRYLETLEQFVIGYNAQISYTY